MKKHYLSFEKPLKDLDFEIEKLSSSKLNSEKLSQLTIEREELEKNIFSDLSPWETVQLARHPNRPYTLDYINTWCDNFTELHGDKAFSDDNAVVGGIGIIENTKVAIIGQQKGRNTKDNIFRNFGMMKPEGYRKALRIMKLAEKFKLPIVTLIDTPGADPGIGAEERGQGYAIANNLFEMASIETQILSIVIGEGASGGALGIGLCDKMIMLEHTWFSVISPEGCASILWKDSKKAPEAAESLKLTPSDLMEHDICNMIVYEPKGGAHRYFDKTATILKETILKELKNLKENVNKDFLENRVNRYDKLGTFRED
ncbi:MAG: acetyl-CoA carboxylase carboxyltransferase subunit alpha [Rickettsiales bacterium TMED289]|nr:MAG: acetyl-CoA carboxylase carboxyltransferase subunit alpha [Rickettsiales bacterium TMED289]|tara:strand:+ start:1137 stop:2081 length:945 start_codon:yes stop_codon:yes gene_type:complete